MEKEYKLPFELQANEVTQLLCRRHWAFVAWNLGKIVLVAVVPIVALLVIVGRTSGLDGRAGQIVAAVSVLWAGFWIFKGYFTWYRFQNDVWVITNQRVVDSTKRHWFHHKMASTDLDDVQDISIKKDGLFPTAFNYGDLLLQTAAEQPQFILSGIPVPKDVLALLDKSRDAAKRAMRGLPSV